jgi:fibronectin type III domain protein
MIPVTDIATPRFQLAVLAVILLGLQSAAMPTIISAAEQEMPRRHSLIHRPDVEPATLPATKQETVLQPPGAGSTRITSPIGPTKASPSPTIVPSTHHRTLTKRPAIASTTAPAPPSQTLSTAPTSGSAAGQVTQAAADTTRGTVPTATAPVTKSTAAPLSGVTSTGSAAVASSASSPFAGAVAPRPVASTGSGSVPSFGGSRSALNLLEKSAIASLLQPPTPVVTTPPPLPPPSTPPSTPPPSPSTENVTLAWRPNTEPDLAGYKVYVGTASGTYSFPGSAFVLGTVTSYTLFNLPKGQTYFFAVSAYDNAGNESGLSAEVSKSLF